MSNFGWLSLAASSALSFASPLKISSCQEQWWGRFLHEQTLLAQLLLPLLTLCFDPRFWVVVSREPPSCTRRSSWHQGNEVHSVRSRHCRWFCQERSRFRFRVHTMLKKASLCMPKWISHWRSKNLAGVDDSKIHHTQSASVISASVECFSFEVKSSTCTPPTAWGSWYFNVMNLVYLFSTSGCCLS